MNYCLRHPCSNGYAILDGVNIKYDNFGAYSYSAVSSLSGMNHDSTAFVGCDQGKCCACFGPKGRRQNYCGPNCTATNGGIVTKEAFVWFWIRNRMPKRLWKTCMELVVKNSAGNLEKHFLDPQTGTAHEGSCSGTFKSFLNEGTLTVSDKESFESLPDVPGLFSYRKDNKRVYVNDGSKWQALSSEQEVQKLKKIVQNQEKKIQNQESKIYAEENKVRNQEDMIKKLGKKIEEIERRTDKVYLVQTCSALLRKHPSATSGNYYIAAQGLRSSPLVQVYCDMTSKNGVGVTVIGHDSEYRKYVWGYESAGSYRREIKYEISMEKIVAIMKQSKSCEQFIRYECYNSMLLTDGDGWWVSRQGSKMNYWGGAAVNSGKCACGMTSSCAGGKKCNCDKNDGVWRQDSGYLKDRSTLPVKELRFGDTGQAHSEAGYHTLGKLRCWG